MTQLAGTIAVKKGHRLYSSLLNLLVVNSSVATAVEIILGKSGKFGPDDDFGAESVLFPVRVRLPLAGAVRAGITGQEPDEIHIAIDQGYRSQHAYEHSTKGFRKVMLNIIAPIFVDFYERSVPLVIGKFGDKPQSWPPIFNFGRVIRNAISHSGKIHFRSPTSPPVTWHHVTYGPAEEGRLIVGGDFHFADFIVLMLEIGDELDQLGVPVP